MPQKRMECFRLLLEHLTWIEHQILSGIRDSRNAPYNVIKVVKGGLGGGHKETFIIPEIFFLVTALSKLYILCPTLIYWAEF